MEKTKKNGCCSCGVDVKEEVDQMVDRVESYTKADRDEKSSEVNEVFGRDDKKK